MTYIRIKLDLSRLNYKFQPVNAVLETIVVYCENSAKHINAICW